jgi:hypothetical protein
MTVAEFQAKYLTQPGGVLDGAERFGVASALKALEDRLASGYEPDRAMELTLAQPFNAGALGDAVDPVHGSLDVIEDFKSVDSL